MVPTIPTFCIGRFLVGVTGGIINNVMGKSLDETIPVAIQGQFGTLLNAYIVFGILLCYALGAILPTDPADLASDNNWRIIFIMPVVIALLQIFLMLCIFKEEPVAFSIA